MPAWPSPRDADPLAVVDPGRDLDVDRPLLDRRGPRRRSRARRLDRRGPRRRSAGTSACGRTRRRRCARPAAAGPRRRSVGQSTGARARLGAAAAAGLAVTATLRRGRSGVTPSPPRASSISTSARDVGAARRLARPPSRTDRRRRMPRRGRRGCRSRSCRAEAAAAQALVPVAVVELARLRVREHLVRLGDLAEALLGVGCVGDVRVQLAREPAERLLDLGLVRVAADAQHLVVVALRRGHRSSVALGFGCPSVGRRKALPCGRMRLSRSVRRLVAAVFVSLSVWLFLVGDHLSSFAVTLVGLAGHGGARRCANASEPPKDGASPPRRTPRRSGTARAPPRGRLDRLLVVHPQRAEQADRAERPVREPVRAPTSATSCSAGFAELVADAHERPLGVERARDERRAAPRAARAPRAGAVAANSSARSSSRSPAAPPTNSRWSSASRPVNAGRRTLEERPLARGRAPGLEARAAAARAEPEPGDLLVQVLAAHSARPGSTRLVERDSALRDAAGRRDDDDHHDVRLQQQHLDVADRRRLERRRRDERQQPRQLGEHLGRRLERRLDLARAAERSSGNARGRGSSRRAGRRRRAGSRARSARGRPRCADA